MMFMIQLIRSMKISVKLPVKLRVDNVGAMFMASNITVTCCINHENIMYKKVNEYVVDGMLMIFITSAKKGQHSERI